MPKISVDDASIEIYKMKVAGKKNKEIAQALGLHPSTVSVKIKKMKKALNELDEKVEKGEIVLRESSRETTALAIPTKNPFEGLDNFNQLAGIASAGGGVFGAAAAEVIDGFNREDLPYEERMLKVMRGGGTLAGSLLSLYCTIKSLSTSLPKEEKTTEEKVANAKPVTTPEQKG